MATRWMQAKLLKQKSERRRDREQAKLHELYNLEHYPQHELAMDQLLAEFLAGGGKVTRCETVKRMPRESFTVTGKNGRRFATKVWSQKPRQGLCAKGILAVS